MNPFEKKKVFILGIDGYLGFSLADYLMKKDFLVAGVDNYLRRKLVRDVGSFSLTPIDDRKTEWPFIYGDITDYKLISQLMADFRPDVVIHFAEQPSAPYSMKGQEEAFLTQKNNILGTLNLLWAVKNFSPKTQIIKLGTMGVYGTPEEDIPESDGAVAYDPASFYHNSKAMDSINLRKACQWWGLNATDLHQGVVYGHYPNTRFDYDEYFGTAVNRFLVQSMADIPLTIYGKGGQTRGFIYIQNTLEAIELAINNPAKGYRVFNQFTEIMSINHIAEMVSKLTGAKIQSIENPRIEKEEHYYKPTHEKLLKLGLKPYFMKDMLPKILGEIKHYKSRIIERTILPKHSWR